MTNQRVAIIGGGIAGMVAANELTRSTDADIVLYERSKNLGGRASTVHKDGFYLNQGAHALYNSGELNKYLQKLAIEPAGAAPPTKNSLAYTKGTFKELPVDLISMARTALLTPSEKLILSAFLAELPNIKTAAIMDLPLRSWLQKRFSQPVLVTLIETLVRLGTYAHAPHLMSAGAAIEQLKIAQDGVKYLDYGWQNIISALRVALPRTVDERVDYEVTAVREVMAEDGPRVAVTAGGATQYFDFVILAIPPHVIEKIAPDLLPKEFSRSLIGSKIACFDICLDAIPNPQNTFALGLEDPLYYSVHSASARLADEDDKTLIHMGVYLESDEHGGQQHLDLMIEMLNKLQPGWESHVIYKRYLPNMVASYATPLAGRNGIAGLPSTGIAASNRILAAGDWVGSGHFLADASAASAINAASRIAAKLSLTERRHSCC